MDVRKTVIGGLCCLAILGGVNYLLNQYGNAGIAIASDVSTSSLGGARQFVGKLDIKSSQIIFLAEVLDCDIEDLFRKIH